MSGLVIPFVSALIGGILVALVNYTFGLRHANKQRRKELVVQHLISAYFALEDYALREPTPEHKKRAAAIEKAMASIFLFGDKKSIELVQKVDQVVKRSGHFDVKELALHLRDRLRKELLLEEVEDNKIIHFRGPTE